MIFFRRRRMVPINMMLVLTSKRSSLDLIGKGDGYSKGICYDLTPKLIVRSTTHDNQLLQVRDTSERFHLVDSRE